MRPGLADSLDVIGVDEPAVNFRPTEENRVVLKSNEVIAKLDNHSKFLVLVAVFLTALQAVAFTVILPALLVQRLAILSALS
jgi:hypothetical protein